MAASLCAPLASICEIPYPIRLQHGSLLCIACCTACCVAYCAAHCAGLRGAVVSRVQYIIYVTTNCTGYRTTYCIRSTMQSIDRRNVVRLVELCILLHIVLCASQNNTVGHTKRPIAWQKRKELCDACCAGDRNGSNGPRSLGMMLAAATLHTTVLTQPAWAGEIEDYVDDAAELLWPILSNLGFSGVMGLAAAAALKVKLGKGVPWYLLRSRYAHARTNLKICVGVFFRSAHAAQRGSQLFFG